MRQPVASGLNEFGATLQQAERARSEMGQRLEECSRDLYSSVEDLNLYVGDQDSIVCQAGEKVQVLASEAVQVAQSARAGRVE